MKKIAIAVVLSAFIATPALAAGNGYIGVNAGKNQIDYTELGSSTGFGILGGYSFNDHVAAEVSYNSLGKATTDSGVDVTGRLIGVAAVGSLPLSQTFSLMGKLGFASSSITAEAPGFSESASNSGLMYGVGAQFNVSKAVGIRFDYTAFTVGDDGANFEKKGSKLMSLGAVFKM